ncbi:hypothetical protein AQUCO_01700444v1 [Aquilegia coerulea]|uniref:Uncharacterized protein n=1 Tax=Aquilegia coerulea TaxID=218851 RepID=A0A2G5DNP8_AQUCA|nr:hypothetical protein AQUCO_01700444v1 [Aquilegia coerulea]
MRAVLGTVAFKINKLNKEYNSKKEMIFFFNCSLGFLRNMLYRTIWQLHGVMKPKNMGRSENMALRGTFCSKCPLYCNICQTTQLNKNNFWIMACRSGHAYDNTQK